MTQPVDLRTTSLTRRHALGLIGAASGAALVSGTRRAAAAGSGQLNVYTWPDYFSAESLSAYARTSGVTPALTTYDSNETLFAKLNSPAGSGFDVVVPTSSWIKQLADKGLLDELDHSRIDFSALDPNLLNRDYDPGNKYSIPKDWGLLGVLYDPDAVGFEIKTWEDFFKAGEQPKVTGKVRLSASGSETIGPALWLAGKDWNAAGETDIRAAGERVKAFAPHVKTFSSLDPNTVANGSIALAQTNQGTARAAINLNPKLKWVVPGPMSELWVDNYAVLKTAPNRDQAYDFLRFQLKPDVQVEQTKYIGFPAALKGLRDKIAPDTKNADLIFGGQGLDFSKLTSFVVNPETIGVWNQVHAEIQAAAG